MYIEEAKFSLWCDFIERDFLEKDFPLMIKNKTVNGATSNPSIFKNAFLTSPAYTEESMPFKAKVQKPFMKPSRLKISNYPPIY
jgi:transaldolase